MCRGGCVGVMVCVSWWLCGGHGGCVGVVVVVCESWCVSHGV